MNDNLKNQFRFDAIEVLLFLYKKKLPIIIITVLGIITSIIASFVITPKFQSKVILFPATQSSLSKSLLTNNPYKDDLMKFGEEEDAERLLQVLYSDYIKDFIINKYNLIEHYEIDTNSAYPQTALYKEFTSNITFKKTEFQSIEIKVLDTDPIIAANIANDIAQLIDTVINNMLKERAIEAYKIVEKQFDFMTKYVSNLEDSLKSIRENGVLDYEIEVEMYSGAYGTALAENSLNSANRAIFENKFAALEKFGGNYLYLYGILEYEKESLVLLREKLQEAKVNAENVIANKFVVNTAMPSEKKSYPIRWLIVSISTISTFLFSIFLVVILDFLKELKTRIEKSNKELKKE